MQKGNKNTGEENHVGDNDVKRRRDNNDVKRGRRDNNDVLLVIYLNWGRF